MVKSNYLTSNGNLFNPEYAAAQPLHIQRYKSEVNKKDWKYDGVKLISGAPPTSKASTYLVERLFATEDTFTTTDSDGKKVTTTLMFIGPPRETHDQFAKIKDDLKITEILQAGSLYNVFFKGRSDIFKQLEKRNEGNYDSMMHSYHFSTFAKKDFILDKPENGTKFNLRNLPHFTLRVTETYMKSDEAKNPVTETEYPDNTFYLVNISACRSGTHNKAQCQYKAAQDHRYVKDSDWVFMNGKANCSSKAPMTFIQIDHVPEKVKRILGLLYKQLAFMIQLHPNSPQMRNKGKRDKDKQLQSPLRATIDDPQLMMPEDTDILCTESLSQLPGINKNGWDWPEGRILTPKTEIVDKKEVLLLIEE